MGARDVQRLAELGQEHLVVGALGTAGAYLQRVIKVSISKRRPLSDYMRRVAGMCKQPVHAQAAAEGASLAGVRRCQ